MHANMIFTTINRIVEQKCPVVKEFVCSLVQVVWEH